MSSFVTSVYNMIKNSSERMNIQEDAVNIFLSDYLFAKHDRNYKANIKV